MERVKKKKWGMSIIEKVRRVEAFHKHLDICIRCSKEPFNLCKIGRMILTGEEGEDNG
jgi:hypothetical protein